MSKGKKLFQTIMITLYFCLLAIGLLPATKVEAAKAVPSCVKKQTVYLYLTDPVGFDYSFNNQYIYIKNMNTNAEIKNVQSSNKKVDARSAYQDRTGGKLKAVSLSYYSKTISDGEKSTIRFTVAQNGKNYKLSCVVTFKKMPVVIKSLKIKNKEYASHLKDSRNCYFDNTSGNIKIKVQLYSGYVLDSIEIFGLDKNQQYVSKTIKNGSSIKLETLYFMSIYYHPVKKPANYSEPLEWNSKQITNSPLQYWFYLTKQN